MQHMDEHPRHIAALNLLLARSYMTPMPGCVLSRTLTYENAMKLSIRHATEAANVGMHDDASMLNEIALYMRDRMRAIYNMNDSYGMIEERKRNP